MSSSNRTLTMAGAIAVASAGAFFAGRMTAPSATTAGADGGPDSSLPAKVSARGADAADGSGTTSRRLSDRSSTREKGPKATKGAEALAKMEELMRNTDPIARTQAWLDFVNSIDPSEFESVVASFRSLGMTESRMTEYAMLLSAWGKKDPLQALAYAQANTGNRFARTTILSTWASYDPAGAIQWAEQNHEAKEGEGNLLDNSMIVWGGGIGDPDRHNHDNLPILVAGRAGGTWTPGKRVVLPSETPMTNLYLSMLDRMGVRAEKVGDSTGVLEGG